MRKPIKKSNAQLAKRLVELEIDLLRAKEQRDHIVRELLNRQLRAAIEESLQLEKKRHAKKHT